MSGARERVVAATTGLIESDGFEAITIAAVARGAGVTRQTVYSLFGDRERLVSEVVVGVAVEALAGIRAALRPDGPAAVYLADLIVGARREVRARPVLAALLRPREGNPLFDEGAMDRAWPVALGLLEPLFEHRPGLRPTGPTDPLVELVLRTGLSVVLFDSPATRDDDDARHLLAEWFRDALPEGAD
ncbi:unannotated protein [freshwater metagenome]|uniref:Unannotated protein n=1 Tax=freshwater metagenome TaxID=449393 RepID=A0A6J7H3D9_9ZZZZ